MPTCLRLLLMAPMPTCLALLPVALTPTCRLPACTSPPSAGAPPPPPRATRGSAAAGARGTGRRRCRLVAAWRRVPCRRRSRRCDAEAVEGASGIERAAVEPIGRGRGRHDSRGGHGEVVAPRCDVLVGGLERVKKKKEGDHIIPFAASSSPRSAWAPSAWPPPAPAPSESPATETRQLRPVLSPCGRPLRPLLVPRGAAQPPVPGAPGGGAAA